MRKFFLTVTLAWGVATTAALAQQVCPSLPTGEPVAAEWRGNGLMITRPFHVDGPFEFQWTIASASREVDVTAFQAMLHTPGHEAGFGTVVANSTQTDRGSAYVSQGGTYVLDINAMGNWTARVILVKPNAQ